uniref:LAGLIDADG endonuclease family protein n=2 Tax=Rhizoctonia solani TaxID=456999 RepID=N0ABX0_9AGAM|nr:LAGLIDADG endonuclease family protein [Rhizoctonia solani]AGK45431.1 LAGLIDADG endonuclease family protein [Rhizoctonia solani]
MPVKPDEGPTSSRISTGLTKEEKAALTLPIELKQILVGLLLGDLNAQKQKDNHNARMRFGQGAIHKEYLLHLYELFKAYCATKPVAFNTLPHKVTGVNYSCVSFNTLSLGCFNELYDLFYLSGIKIVPANIFDLLTPLGLAYWISDDGFFSKSNKIVKLCTDSFLESDVDLLIQVLENKFNLECRKEKRGKGFRIVIKNKSLGTLRELVCPHLHSSMLYKLGL